VKSAKSPVDLRPFRSKADSESDLKLERKYRKLAIPCLVAVVELAKTKANSERSAVETRTSNRAAARG
jgi:hypothetical protein